MAGVDYIGAEGLERATRRWLAALAPYRRQRRPAGDPIHSALLVLDLQGLFCDPTSHAYLPAVEHVLPGVRALAEVFRAAGSPVLFTRHALAAGEDPGRMGDWWGDVVRDGEPAGALDPRAGVVAGDAVLRKTRYDAFAGTGLARRLDDAGVDTLVIAGVATHLCCETTARAAFARGFHVTIAADATASFDEALHRGALRALAHGFARVRTVRELSEERRAAGGAELAAGDGVDLGGIAEPAAEPVDVAVVGAGPAGLAAALQAHREGLRVLLLEGRRAGGLLWQADRVENHLGAGALSGPALVARQLAQAHAAGVRWAPGEVTRVVVGAERFALELAAGGSPRTARAVVLATGTRPRRAGFAGERALAGVGVFDGVDELLRARGGPAAGRAVVVGGGDAAFDQATTLRRRGWEVAVLLRGARPRALARLLRRADALGVARLTGIEIAAARPDDGRVRLTSRGELPPGWRTVDAVLVAVGRAPSLPAIVDRRDGVPSRPLTDAADLGEVPGLHLAGDVRRGRLRQVAMATGDGIEAAMRVAAWLGGARR